MEYSRNAKKQIIEEVMTVLHFEGEKIPKNQQLPETESVLDWVNGSYQVIRTCEYHTHGLHIYAYRIMPDKHNKPLNNNLTNRVRICDKSGTIVFDSGCGINSCIAIKGKWRRKLRSIYLDALYEDPTLFTTL